MTLRLRGLMFVCCVVCLAGSAQAQNPGGLPGTEHVAARLAYQQAERVVLYGDVVHYQFDVVVGPGEYDKIRIHRVVKETEPNRPTPKMEGVFLLPGAPQRFEPIFMQPASSGSPAGEGSIALFLASNGVDVWGIDYGWSFIPDPHDGLLGAGGMGPDQGRGARPDRPLDRALDPRHLGPGRRPDERPRVQLRGFPASTPSPATTRSGPGT